jgi:biotin carboxylase
MKKILMIGAGFLQDFVIQKAKSMGYYVLALDANPNAVGFKHADKFSVIDILDKESCLKYAQKEQIDGVLTVATDYGVITTSYISKVMGLPGLNYETAKLIKNKFKVREILSLNNVDDNLECFEVSVKTDISKLSKKIKYPIMVKPCDGSGSKGASRVNNHAQLEQACKLAIKSSTTGKVEIESFIVGDEFGVESFVENGNIHVLAIMKKWMTKPPYYAELGHAIPSGLSSKLEKKIIITVKKAIEVLNINYGSVNMDLLITDSEKIYIIDIGARMGGNMIGSSIVPYATGIDYMGNIIKISTNEELDWSIGEKKAVVSKIMAYSGGIVKKLPILDKYKNGDVQIYHHLKIGDIVNEYQTNLDGCGYVIVFDEKVDEAKNKAELILDDIERTIF